MYLVFAVVVEELQKKELEFQGDKFVGLNTSCRIGSVLVGDHSGHLLYRFTLHIKTGFYSEMSKPLPVNVTSFCSKYLTDTNDIMLRDWDENSTTSLFSHDKMKMKARWEHNGDHLIACLPGPRAVYVVKDGEQHCIEIRSQTGEVKKLKLDTLSWGKMLSLCENTESKRIAVLDSSNDFTGSLDIFSEDGKLHIMYIFLRFMPTILLSNINPI